jgi:DNA-binding GntR family transcriptional regulator
VKPISEKEVDEICEIRAAIELLGARWAMEKAHEKLKTELKKNIAASEEKISKGDVRSFVDMDAKFHEIISKLSGSQRLVELAQNLRRHMLRYRVQSIYSVDNVLRAIEGHKGILLAIEKQDFNEVNRAMGYHLEQSKKDILKYAFKESPKPKLGN